MTAEHPLVAEMLVLLSLPAHSKSVEEARQALYLQARLTLDAMSPRLDVEMPGGVDRVLIRDRLVGLAAVSLATAVSLGLATHSQALEQSIPF